MDAHQLELLINTWMTGWAQSRGYEPQRKGRAFVIPRPARPGESKDTVETLLVCPSAEEIAAHGSAEDGTDFLVIVTQNLPGSLEAAAGVGLPRPLRTETLMISEIQENDVEAPRPPGDDVECHVEHPEEGVTRVQVTVKGVPAASGVVSVVDSVAVFDRIETAPEYRRRGLASYVMRCLTHAVLDEGIETGLLAASPEGRLLYAFLGWEDVADIPVFARAGA